MKKLAEINVSMPELHSTCLQMLAPLPYCDVVNKNEVQSQDGAL